MQLAELDSFSPLRSEPPDFDAFWSNTREQLLEIDPQPTLARQKPPARGLIYDLLTYRSFGNVSISGYLLTHDVPEPRPLIVHSHGYNSQYDVMLNWANSGCNILGIDFRGFGRSQHLGMALGGYVLTGIGTASTSILRGAAMDLVQALRTARLLLGSRLAATTLYGFSFGGAMALMAAALDTELDFMVVGQPTFGWHNERLRLSRAGSSAELNRYLGCKPGKRDNVMQTLNYFDTMHTAARIRTPVMVGIGLDDDVVPSRSVMAVTNHLAAPQIELRILPVAHSDDPRESLWSAFDDEWIEMARHGIPDDFGASDRRVASLT